VLIVAPSLEIIGGLATQAAALMSHLGREPGVEVDFLATNPRLPGPLRWLQSIKYARTIGTSGLYVSRLLRRVPRADVVHVFSAHDTSFVISSTPPLILARLFRRKALLHYHSGEADTHLRRWRRTGPATMRLFGAIVVPSAYNVGQFGRHGIRTQLIPNVLDVDRFEFRERQPLQPVFLCNRQLVPYCNVGCVVRAFAEIQARVSDARLIVGADGPERPRLEALARELGLRDADFVGWVEPERVAELYDSADVYLNGSDQRDNVPVSILEAFASGLPVVSTDVAGVPELVHHERTGLLVPPGDHAAMAEQALRLLADPELAGRLARNAREECSRFAWARIREQWLGLYRSL
jgi:L-malate glycosyltransferase